MKIRLKEYVDKQNLSLVELSNATKIPEIVLIEMYEMGVFDETILTFANLTNLMIALNLTNVQDLVPDHHEES
jgi:hypothetical protein